MCKTLSSWRRCLFQLVSLAFRVGCPIMVGGAVADLTATTEPDVKVFLHPALRRTGSCAPYGVLVTSTLSGGHHHDSDHAVAPDWPGHYRYGCHSGGGFREGLLS